MSCVGAMWNMCVWVCVWNMCGSCVGCVVFVWVLCVTCVDVVWMLCRTCVEHVWMLYVLSGTCCAEGTAIFLPFFEDENWSNENYATYSYGDYMQVKYIKTDRNQHD